jgi:hypothetical protein
LVKTGTLVLKNRERNFGGFKPQGNDLIADFRDAYSTQSAVSEICANKKVSF